MTTDARAALDACRARIREEAFTEAMNECADWSEECYERIAALIQPADAAEAPAQSSREGQ